MKKTKHGAALILTLLLSLSLLLSGCYMIPVINGLFGYDIPLPTQVTESPDPAPTDPAVLPTADPIDPTEPGSAYDEAEEQAFRTFTDGIFAAILEDAGTLTTHFYCADPESFGIDTSVVSWGSFDWGEEADEVYKATLDDWMASLQAYDQQKLSSEGRYMYDILKDYILLEYDSLGYTFYYEPLSSAGVQAYIPIELTEFKLNNEKDIEDYLGLMEGLPAYYARILEYEKEKSEAGFFMEDDRLDEVLDQARDMIGELEGEDSFMISTFEKRLDDLGITGEQKRVYMERNEEAVRTAVIPAYEAIIAELEPLRGTAQYTGNLSSMPDGKAYYEYLVASATGSSLSVTQMKDLLEQKIREGLADLQRVSTSPELYRYQDRDVYPSTDPNLCLKILEEKIRQDFPTVDGIDYEVSYVDDSLRDYLAPAMYMIRPYGSTQKNSILINCDKGDEPDNIFITLAHEGFPGHMLQTNYLVESSRYPLRFLLETSGFSEGYAEYVEHYSYSYLDVPEAVQDYHRLISEVTIYLYARADVGIEYEGWDAVKTGRYMAEYFEDPEEIGEWMYGHICGDPGGYLDYAIGMLEIRTLYDVAKQAGASDLWFHRQLLGLSGAPFQIIRQYMFD